MSMKLDRVPGEDNLYIGSMFAAGRHAFLTQNRITHILSVLPYTQSELASHKSALEGFPEITRAYVPVDDTEEEDMLMHFPRIVRFIETGLDDGRRKDQKDASALPPTPSLAPVPPPPGGRIGRGVYVHCALGRSRSATAVVAYLLWKYPARFGTGISGTGPSSPEARRDDPAAAAEAVDRALALVRQARPMVQPNAGFLQQLALWWRMGCPAGADDAVERHAAYQRWLYQRDVKASARSGRPPERLWFGDEAQAASAATPTSAETTNSDSDCDSASASASAAPARPTQLRCKICRRVLAASPFVLPHNPDTHGTGNNGNGCAHYFLEPLSWMRPELEKGALDGRLVCPNPKCATILGRYSWRGFKCTCSEWVCPAFSLQKGKVDQVAAGAATVAAGAPAATTADGGSPPPFSIRLPPGARVPSKAENL